MSKFNIKLQETVINKLSASLLTAVLLLAGCGSQPEKENVEVNLDAPQAKPAIALESFNSADELKFRNASELIKNGHYEEAIKQFKKLSGQNSPASADANLALAYYKMEDMDKAAKHMGIALQKKPGNASYLSLNALIAMESGRFQEAEKSLKKALSSNKDHTLANYNLALLYDIYYQDIPKAYNYYLKYLNLVNYEDKETVQWVEQLRYSLGEE
ncbi:Tetratricopeptide repeat-containing protein [Alteromonadaceae bacterium Bs31]|nr:Tetratricopeptide repeat-containing protein [Alteromonadaceae bacterium Bs31]